MGYHPRLYDSFIPPKNPDTGKPNTQVIFCLEKEVPQAGSTLDAWFLRDYAPFCLHTRPEWALFHMEAFSRQQAEAVSCRGLWWPAGEQHCHKVPFLQKEIDFFTFMVSVENKNIWIELLTAASSVFFQDVFVSASWDLCSVRVYRLCSAPNSSICPVADAQSCWLAGQMDGWTLEEKPSLRKADNITQVCPWGSLFFLQTTLDSEG